MAQCLSFFLRHKCGSLRQAFHVLDIEAEGQLSVTDFSRGLERLGYPLAHDAATLFEPMAGGRGWVSVSGFVAYLEPNGSRSSRDLGSTLATREPDEEGYSCSRVETTESLASSTAMSGTAPWASRAASEETCMSFEAVVHRFEDMLATAEDSMNDRLGRLEERLGAMESHIDSGACEANEWRAELQRSFSDLDAKVCQAAQLASGSVLECERLRELCEQSTVSALPDIEGVLQAKMAEIMAHWDAVMAEERALTQERLWGLQARAEGVRLQLERDLGALVRQELENILNQSSEPVWPESSTLPPPYPCDRKGSSTWHSSVKKDVAVPRTSSNTSQTPATSAGSSPPTGSSLTTSFMCASMRTLGDLGEMRFEGGADDNCVDFVQL